MKQQFALPLISLMAITLLISCNSTNSGTSQGDAENGVYVAGDFHQHTTYSGGDYSIGHVMEASNKFGLDWWSNSDHGGTRENWGRSSGIDLGASVSWTCAGIKQLGSPQEAEDAGYMWRWQSLRDYNFQDIMLWRRIFPDKLILQAFEWNVPGHEHANISIIASQFDPGKENCNPLAQFEYMFDDEDNDTTGGQEFGWEKSRVDGKEKALQAVKWLQENYPMQTYVVPSHPDKSGGYTISDFRDFNNTAPDVCFGFDGMPGHQKNATRGSYDLEDSPFKAEINGKMGATFGGAGIFASRIGGLWDALLSEGRRWWISASSDYHSDDDFNPGEYQKTYTYVLKRNDAQALIDGMRSGNRFIVTGDLIKSLKFRVGNTMMGQTFKTDRNNVKIEIEVFDPDSSNFNTYSDYTNPELDHIDLIAGQVTGLISPSSPDYSKDNVSTSRVIARFDAAGGVRDANGLESIKWIDLGNGRKKITFETQVNGKMYFRLRGTNLALNTPGELDGEGNPLPDIAEENNGVKAFSDLWFYSNPVFVEHVSGDIKQTAGLSQEKWYRGNTHTHATFSDENDTNDVPIIAKWYEDAGYNFLVLSEHNDHVLQKKIFCHDEASNPPGFIMLCGNELSESRHHTALGINSFIGGETSLQDGVARTIAAGGVPILNHPQDPVVSASAFIGTTGLNHLEVVNGGRLQDTPSTEALWDSVLSAPNGRMVYAVAADDNHYKEANVGRGWIMVRAAGLTKSDILESIRSGNFYATTGVILNDYKAGNKSISVDSQNGDTIKFIGKNGALLRTVIGDKATYRPKKRNYYVRAKIISSEGKMAWTQPVFTD
ncbi:MAG: hypothetical protein WAL29_11320 [Bacteroidales bacterium]